jgi:hypothetical protein
MFGSFHRVGLAQESFTAAVTWQASIDGEPIIHPLDVRTAPQERLL